LNVQFETALKYVEIPLFDNSPCGSRTEATSILTWLKLCKGVGHIYEVRVEDSLQNPHSEENIENALMDLNVRSLDWRRVDLSICTILACAPNVEKLHLYSSGNLAAIDHWLGNHGTSTLTKVRHTNRTSNISRALHLCFSNSLVRSLIWLLITLQLSELHITIINVGLPFNLILKFRY